VVDQIRYAAASGGSTRGTAALHPPLSEELRVNRNTVAKAYAELESQASSKRFPARAAF